jgi:hypothetical protein
MLDNTLGVILILVYTPLLFLLTLLCSVWYTHPFSLHSFALFDTLSFQRWAPLNSIFLYIAFGRLKPLRRGRSLDQSPNYVIPKYSSAWQADLQATSRSSDVFFLHSPNININITMFIAPFDLPTELFRPVNPTKRERCIEKEQPAPGSRLVIAARPYSHPQPHALWVESPVMNRKLIGL